MRKSIIAILLTISTLSTWAQSFEFSKFYFKDDPYTIPAAFQNEDEIFIEKVTKKEVILEEKKQPYEITLNYFKLLVNSEDAIDANNKIYFPYDMDEYIIQNKLRVINPDKSIIELKDSDILTGEDQESGVKYKYFAIKGLQKGSIIERILILKGEMDWEGVSISFQGATPILKNSFELIYPDHIDFAIKTYNGLPEAKRVEAYKEKRAWLVEDTNIPTIPETEEFFNESRMRKFLRYKLDKNDANGAKNLINYTELATNIYEVLNQELSKNEEKAIQKFVAGIPKSSNQAEQIRAIEDYVKTNINFDKNFGGNKSFVDAITTKQGKSLDIIRIYHAVFKNFGIEMQPVMTSKRYEKFFDKDFESYDQVNDVLLYFPKTNQYLEPNDFGHRTPLFNFNYAENYGLHIKEIEFGSAKMGVGEVKKIPFSSIQNVSGMDIVVDFTNDIDNPIITNTTTFQGYDALNIQPYKDFVTAEVYEDFKKDVAKSYSADVTMDKIELENDGMQYVAKKPLIMKTTFKGEPLTQKAGNKVLFKVGELIGKQMEMYQKETRSFPIEIYFPKVYNRKIVIKLPKGYSIANIKDVERSHVMKLQDGTTSRFVTTTQKNGNTYTITNVEDYTSIHIPTEQFSEYRTIINAAADFNKIQLVIVQD